MCERSRLKRFIRCIIVCNSTPDVVDSCWRLLVRCMADFLNYNVISGLVMLWNVFYVFDGRPRQRTSVSVCEWAYYVYAYWVWSSLTYSLTHLVPIVITVIAFGSWRRRHIVLKLLMIVCNRKQSQATHKLLFPGIVLRNVLILAIASLFDTVHYLAEKLGWFH